jgi:hypothetical protein
MGSRVFEVVQKYIKRPTNPQNNRKAEFMYGYVQSISPLQIKFDNNQIVNSDFIVLSCLCKEAVIEIPFRYQGKIRHKHQAIHDGYHNTTEELPEIMLWRGLQPGDRVRALCVNGGQLYYVFEREEGIVL